MRRVWLSVPLVAVLTACGPSTRFNEFEEEYWSKWLRANPSVATGVGVHDYDALLEDFSQAAVARREDELKKMLATLQNMNGLSSDQLIDGEILRSAIRAELLELQTIQSWKSNPMMYIGTPGGAIDALMKRNFAPKAKRLEFVVSRLQEVPKVIAAMKANVANPPKEFTDLAIRMAGGSIGFYKNTVASWAKDAVGGDPRLTVWFDNANEEAVKAMMDAVKWLKTDLLPRSKGAYAINAANFAKKLRYEEMVEVPLDRILAIGEANLEKDYKAFIETARRIDPTKTPAEVMASISNDHPTEADLIPATRRTLLSIRKFLVDKKIIDLPNDGYPLVEETPPYARSGTFASMDSPGAYETKATEAFYYVTPPEKEWDAKHKEEHLRLYNKPVMDIITIHEVFPGHFTQFLFAPQFPTKTRKLYSCSSNAEGWAHYAEQMMLEEGFRNGDPKIRLAQLSEALLRDCRYVVGIKLHTQGMTVEQGARVFIDKGFQEPANAYEESRRGAYNPTYLYYTLGKLQVYKLREDYKKAKGADFKLARFHADFVKQGAIPIKLIRRILLGEDGQTL
ncbi:MAG: DUF885 domain-containing protein [Acidobacteria bacterium]|nr:DUF885 domain-containing protein [Acidobacteriota bacterium]